MTTNLLVKMMNIIRQYDECIHQYDKRTVVI
jgi:hypothetical protein